MDEIAGIFVVQVDDCGVVYLEELRAKSWQHSHCSSVQHQDQEGIVVGPGQVVDLEIGLTFAVEGRVVLGCHKLKEFHCTNKFGFLVDKEDLAVNFMDAVHCNGD